MKQRHAGKVTRKEFLKKLLKTHVGSLWLMMVKS